MKTLIERIRGAVGIGLTWAVGWGLVGALLGLVRLPDGGHLIGVIGGFLWFALYGFLCGGAFSVALSVAGRRRTFDEMSLPLFAVGGALAALLIFAATSGGELFVLGHVVPATIFALLGAGCAAGSLAVARMADDAELLEAGEDVADIGLTKDEKRELLAK